MNIIHAMEERRSVRTFESRPLPESLVSELTHFASNVNNPFGGRFTIRLKQFDIKEGFKPSTYGMIRGAENYFTIAMADDETSALAVGFVFEQVVLKAWEKGLGTCWIAATFKGTRFDTTEAWPAGQKLRIVCPVGYAAPKSMMERIARFAVGSKNRKPFNSLFFTDNFQKPLSTDNPFARALEMLRLAPSSTNSQPWRALVADNDTVHFYYEPKSKCSVLDCGIGLSHFRLTEQHYGHSGRFFKTEQAPAPKDNWKHLVSYKRD